MQSYHQIGGFENHLKCDSANWFEDKPLAEALAGPHSPLRSKDPNVPIEFVLGIKRTGSSHLLLTTNETRHNASRMRLEITRTPLPADSFVSLSPIHLKNAEDLGKKLSALKPKSQKGRGRGGDTSQANRSYMNGDAGIIRGAFEHGRLLYRVLQHNIDLGKYSLRETSWLDSLRICSFVFNTKSADDRPSWERIRYPSVLDIGFAEAEIPTLQVKENSVRHLVTRTNAFQSRGSPKLDFRFGKTDILEESAILERIIEFLAVDQGRPTIILTHNGEQTKNALGNLGVQVSEWLSGIGGLVGFDRVGPVQGDKFLPQRYDPRRRNNPGDFSSNSARPYDDYEGRRDRPRSRSRSPGRRSSSSRSNMYEPRSQHATSSTLDQRSAHVARSVSDVYVVDVKEMFMTMMQESERFDNPIDIPTIAERLGIPQQESGWCAGNESALILDIWQVMISGLPIDEQREIRTSALYPLDCSQPPADTVPDLNDEERDPNDAVPVPYGQHIQGVLDPDSGSDYGSDSD